MKSRSNKPRAVVLMSGGMDSCVTAAIASQNYELAVLHASYGQRTERRELQAFYALCEYFRAAERLAVRLDYFSAIGGSSLIDSRMQIRDADLASSEIPSQHRGRKSSARRRSSSVRYGRIVPDIRTAGRSITRR